MAITFARDIPDLKEKVLEYAGGAKTGDSIHKITIINKAGYQGVTVNFFEDKDDADPANTINLTRDAFNSDYMLRNYMQSGWSMRGDPVNMSGQVTMTLDDVIGIFNGSYYFEKDGKVNIFHGNSDASLTIYLKSIF